MNEAAKAVSSVINNLRRNILVSSNVTVAWGSLASVVVVNAYVSPELVMLAIWLAGLTLTALSEIRKPATVIAIFDMLRLMVVCDGSHLAGEEAFPKSKDNSFFPAESGRSSELSSEKIAFLLV